jgi:O-antigen/teichoic acid export membrane protein
MLRGHDIARFSTLTSLKTDRRPIRASLRQSPLAARYLALSGGELFSKVCILFAFGYLARVLEPGAFGIVELALSVVLFAGLAVEVGTGSYGARVIAADETALRRLLPQVMLLRGALSIPAYVLVSGLALYYDAAGLDVLAVYGVVLLIAPFLTQWVFQGLRQMHWVAAGTALRSLVFAAMVLALVDRGADLRLVAIAEIGGVAALALLNAVVLHGWFRVGLEWRGAMRGAPQLFREVWSLGASDLTWACLWYAPVLLTGWIALDRPEQVAWIAASVRIVIALHTFVWLYFFNLLPSLTKELAAGFGGWRDLVERSMATSLWAGGLAGVVGTLVAPVLLPLIYGPAFGSAVRPFQIVVWMIPVAWFSGHFRYSLIAAGHQRAEFAALAATAGLVVPAAAILIPWLGSTGAATALLLGGSMNAVLTLLIGRRLIGTLDVVSPLRPVAAAAAFGGLAGLAATMVSHPIVGALLGAAIYLAAGYRHVREMRRLGAAWFLR